MQNDILAKFSPSTPVFICGDMNIDFLNPAGRDNDYVWTFFDCIHIHLINKPTTEDSNSSKCIDHIWTNQLFEICSGRNNVNIIDHYIIFLYIKCFDINLNYEIRFTENSKVCSLNNSEHVPMLIMMRLIFVRSYFQECFMRYITNLTLLEKKNSCRSFFKLASCIMYHKS